MVYLHERYLQVRYLQYDQVWYICQRDQFQRMAFQGIETPQGELYLHGLYLQGWGYLHMWAREAYTEGAACHLRRLESLCGPSSVWGLLGGSGGHASC